ncbi:MAG TPA: hypothetical protein VIP05_19440, partial [Burkholderiaceae bacterium]
MLALAALGLATAAASAGRLPTAAPDPACPARAAAVIENFVGADCTDCWAATAERVPGAQAAGDDAFALD